MGLLSRGQAMLTRRMKQAAGVSVTYTRKGQSITVSAAILGRAVFSSNLDGGARIEFGDRDYLIAVDDLTFGAPQLGDRITESVDGVACVFEVMTPATGEPAWRYSDPGRTLWRIHVKQQRA